jgi:uncharacterized membrane protein
MSELTPQQAQEAEVLRVAQNLAVSEGHDWRLLFAMERMQYRERARVILAATQDSDEMP